MNDLSKDRLASLDDVLLQAIREVFDEAIEKEKPQIIEGEDNNSIGQKYRAYEDAKQIVEKGFIDLKSYRIDKKFSKTFSKER